MDYQALAQEVCRVARGAGALILHREKLEIYEKEGHANFVTSMDLASQKYIIRHLAPLVPGAHFMAEEEGMSQLTQGHCWVIDPIDGTSNYMYGLGYSAISIALALEGECVLGVVYNPYADECFCGVKGLGATLGERALRVSNRPLAQALVVFGTSPYYRDKAPQTFAAMQRVLEKCCDLRRFGSAALDLCCIAAGRCDGFFESYLSPWDYAAASLIVREAGGRVESTAPDGWSLTSGRGIVAGNPNTFPELMELVLEK